MIDCPDICFRYYKGVIAKGLAIFVTSPEKVDGDARPLPNLTPLTNIGVSGTLDPFRNSDKRKVRWLVVADSTFTRSRTPITFVRTRAFRIVDEGEEFRSKERMRLQLSHDSSKQ